MRSSSVMAGLLISLCWVFTDKFLSRYRAGFVVFSLAKLEPHFPEFPSLHSFRLARAAGDILFEIWKVAVTQQSYSFRARNASAGPELMLFVTFLLVCIVGEGQWPRPRGSVSSDPISSLASLNPGPGTLQLCDKRHRHLVEDIQS